MGEKGRALETLGVSAFRGLNVLLTGHTGFKGSWLALWLQNLGATVTGIALPPDASPNHWNLLRLDMDSRVQDIRDADGVARIVRDAKPDLVFHLAAQALVRPSYDDPLATWNANVMGTAHVLEAIRRTPSVRAAIMVTTDKCYENDNRATGYREDDKLGGHDPYSASKAAAELVTASYRQSYFGGADAPLIASARAGNVFGGGDWSRDRLIPDLARAFAAKRELVIRSPQATRPWQHVLDALSGYLCLAERLLQGDRAAARAWNFGPDQAETMTVEAVLRELQKHWPGTAWRVDPSPQPHEAAFLRLDSDAARDRLNWRPLWPLGAGLERTASWYRAYLAEGTVLSAAQLDDYAGKVKRAA